MAHRRIRISVLDVRADDFAKLFRIGRDGKISATSGEHQDWATWNIALLGLYQWDIERKELLDLLAVCEDAILYPDEEVPARTLDRLAPILAARYLFFEVHGIVVTSRLATRLRVERENAKAADESR